MSRSTPASTAIVEVPAPPRVGSASSTRAVSGSRSSREGVRSASGSGRDRWPGTPEADRFYHILDGYFAAFDALGAVVGLTADHGMNDKNDATGRPNIVYLSPLLDAWVGRVNERKVA